MSKYTDFDLLEAAPDDAVGVLVRDDHTTCCYIRKLCQETARNWCVLPVWLSHGQPINYKKREWRFIDFGVVA